MIVVVFIIGIITTIAVTSLNRDPVDLVEEEARRLHALMQLASEEATLQSREFAIQFHKDGYQFMRLETNGEQWNWTPVSGDRILRPRCLHDLVQMEVSLEGEETELVTMGCAGGKVEQSDEDESSIFDAPEEEELHPRIFLLSSGEMTPFEITLPVNDEGESYRLVGHLHGEVVYLRPGEDPDDA